MPYVDLTTGKIVGCKEGSLSWLHEQGHIIFNKTDKGIRNNYLGDSLIKGAVILLTFNALIHNMPSIVLAVSFVSASIFFYFYEEVWCWKYAYLKNKKIKQRLKNEEESQDNISTNN